MDETDAMRMALTASRSDNSRYQSLELDEEDSSEDENQNPFAVPAITMDYSAMNMNYNNPFSIEANPFMPAIQYETAPLQLENNPFMMPQVRERS